LESQRPSAGFANTILWSHGPVILVCSHKGIPLARSGLNVYLDWKTRFVTILTFETAMVIRISELI
jgi:hypothetical protein